MKIKATLLAILLLPAFCAQAEDGLELSKAEMLGSWSVDAESIHPNGQGSRSLETTWTFKEDGTMVGESVDSQQHARIGRMRAVLNYRIVDGKMIRQAAPGRSKEQTCTAFKKDGKKLVLKCVSLYFFMTKLD